MRASVIVVNKDGRDDLQVCLTSLQRQTVDEYEIILVDNDSSDGSVRFVKEQFPDVNIIENDTNRWYAGGNNDGVDAASGEYIAVLNPDVEVEESWLSELLLPLENGEAEFTTSKIVFYDDRDILNASGNVAHYTGIGYCRGKGRHVSEYDCEESVSAISGCAFAVHQETLADIGQLDEKFEFYYEDLDLSWRAHITGKKILYVPDSVVYHKYSESMPPWRFYNMERNRHTILLKHFRITTLIQLLPAILLTELLMWTFTFTKGISYVTAKLRAYTYLFRHSEEIIQSRHKIQTIRKKSDAELLSAMSTKIPVDQFVPYSSLSKICKPVLRIAYTIGYRLGS